MPLLLSCQALYFPDAVSENRITVSWTDTNQPTPASKDPGALVVFKVKCTAPHLFHVEPRFGAFLMGVGGHSPSAVTDGSLSDAAGATSSCRGSAQIAFALREPYVRLSTSKRDGKERFAVDYVYVAGNSSAYATVHKALQNIDSRQRTETLRAVFEEHAGGKATVVLLAYLERVVASATGAAGEVVIPPSAQIVPMTFHQRVTSLASATTTSATRAPGDGASGSEPGPTLSQRSFSDAPTVADTASTVSRRRRQVSSEAVATSPSYRGGANGVALTVLKAEVMYMREALAQGIPPAPSPSSVRSPQSGPVGAGAAATRHVPQSEAEVVMQTPRMLMPEPKSPSSPSRRWTARGIPLVVVLILMHVTFLCGALLCGSRRSAGPASSPSLNSLMGNATLLEPAPAQVVAPV